MNCMNLVVRHKEDAIIIFFVGKYIVKDYFSYLYY